MTNAESYIKKLIDDNPSNKAGVDIYKWYGYSLEKINKNQRAAEVFYMTYNMNPADPESVNLLIRSAENYIMA